MLYLSRKNKFKKFALALFLLCLLSFTAINSVYAQGGGGSSAATGSSFGDIVTGIPKTICAATDNFLVCVGKWADTVLTYLVYLAVVFAVILIAYAGVEYIILGKGDAAKSRIIAAVVGLVIAFVAFVFVRMVVNTLK